MTNKDRAFIIDNAKNIMRGMMTDKEEAFIKDNIKTTIDYDTGVITTTVLIPIVAKIKDVSEI
ncbi:MAG: hypothetical protein V3V61_03935 [Gammaproteobacteria bacterium]